MDFQPLQEMNSYHKEVSSALESVSQSDLNRVINRIAKTVVSANRIWIAGNGGSSATASHFSADLMRSGIQKKYYVRAISLSESTARVTAIGNDYSYDEIFERQILSHASANDLLILLSASGNSQNLIRGLRAAKELEIQSISFVGFDGGILKKESDLFLHFSTNVGAYEVAEDAHSLACHYIAMNVRAQLDHLVSLDSDR